MKVKVTEITNGGYMREQGSLCPNCGQLWQEDVTVLKGEEGVFELWLGANSVSMHIRCEKCGTTWVEHLTTAYISNLEVPDEEG